MNTAKRTIGIVIIAILLGLASQGAIAGEWTKFVLHVRQGPVDGAVVGGGCKGESEEGVVRTTGCARRRPAIEGAWLNGECWITIRYWDAPLSRARILENWGHELAHCVGKHHDGKGDWYEG